MRKIAFVLALISAVSLALPPTAQSFAAASAKERVTSVNDGTTVYLLTQSQLNALAPGTRAKLTEAGVPVRLTAAERKLLASYTELTMRDLKAGAIEWAVVVPIVISVVGYVIEYREAVLAGKTPPSFFQFLVGLACRFWSVACVPQSGGAPRTTGTVTVNPTGQSK